MKNYLEITYSKERFSRTSAYPSKLASFINETYFKSKDGYLVDVGSGIGIFSKEFSKLQNIKSPVTGLDRDGVHFNGSLRSPQKINFENEVFKQFENCFDFVFSKSVVEHLRQPIFLMEQMNNILKPRGKAVVMTPSWKHTYKKSFYVDATHATPFTKLSLLDAMKIAGFKNVQVEYFYQLPFTWKYNSLKAIPRLLRQLPIPYGPVDEVPWRVTSPLNKIIRFSNEVMLLAIGEKGESA